MRRAGEVSVVTSALHRGERLRRLGVEDDVELGGAGPAVFFAYRTANDAARDAGGHLVDDVGHVDVRRERRRVTVLVDDVDVRTVVAERIRRVTAVLDLPGHDVVA